MRVTAADFIKRYGTLADRALTEPVMITNDGRDRLVLLSAAEYERLTLRDRRAVLPEELAAADVAAIMAAEVDPRYDHLNEEIRGWQP